MSRKPVKDEFDMESFMSGKPQDKKGTADVQPTDERGTNDGQSTDERLPMKKYQIRMNENNWNRIKRHCDSRGLSISAFIRMATKEYMERQGI